MTPAQACPIQHDRLPCLKKRLRKTLEPGRSSRWRTGWKVGDLWEHCMRASLSCGRAAAPVSLDTDSKAKLATKNGRWLVEANQAELKALGNRLLIHEPLLPHTTLLTHAATASDTVPCRLANERRHADGFPHLQLNRPSSS